MERRDKEIIEQVSTELAKLAKIQVKVAEVRNSLKVIGRKSDKSIDKLRGEDLRMAEIKLTEVEKNLLGIRVKLLNNLKKGVMR